MQTDFDPSVPPTWLVHLRETIYFVAKHWWFIVPGVILLGRACGLTWSEAGLLGLLVLITIVVAPLGLGVLIAFVSRARRRRAEQG